MKKCSLVLSLILVLCLGVPAFAAGDTKTTLGSEVSVSQDLLTDGSEVTIKIKEVTGDIEFLNTPETLETKVEFETGTKKVGSNDFEDHYYELKPSLEYARNLSPDLTFEFTNAYSYTKQSETTDKVLELYPKFIYEKDLIDGLLLEIETGIAFEKKNSEDFIKTRKLIGEVTYEKKLKENLLVGTELTSKHVKEEASANFENTIALKPYMEFEKEIAKDVALIFENEFNIEKVENLDATGTFESTLSIEAVY